MNDPLLQALYEAYRTNNIKKEPMYVHGFFLRQMYVRKDDLCVIYTTKLSKDRLMSPVK